MTDIGVSEEAEVVRDNQSQQPLRGRLALTAALLGFFMISLDATAVNVALTPIGRSLHGATSGLQWVVDGYTVPFAALLISAGTVSDWLGARRVFGWGLVVFAAASAWCGLAPVLPMLVAARVVQGCAAAVMLPSSLALVRQAFADQAARARAVAVWSSGGAAAIAAGPVLGGILTSAAGWRSVFFVNLPVGAAVLALHARQHADLRGAAAAQHRGRVRGLSPARQVTLVLSRAKLTDVDVDRSQEFVQPTCQP